MLPPWAMKQLDEMAAKQGLPLFKHMKAKWLNPLLAEA